MLDVVWPRGWMVIVFEICLFSVLMKCVYQEDIRDLYAGKLMTYSHMARHITHDDAGQGLVLQEAHNTRGRAIVCGQDGIQQHYRS